MNKYNYRYIDSTDRVRYVFIEADSEKEAYDRLSQLLNVDNEYCNLFLDSVERQMYRYTYSYYVGDKKCYTDTTAYTDEEALGNVHVMLENDLGLTAHDFVLESKEEE